jgi:hypothetical protein
MNQTPIIQVNNVVKKFKVRESELVPWPQPATQPQWASVAV